MTFDPSWNEFADARSSNRGSLRRYFDVILERRWFVISAVVLCTAAAAAYAVTAQKVYKAHADILVTPIPAADTDVLGFGLIRVASDPTQAGTTAALLIDNTSVAALVGQNLGLKDSPQALLSKVSVQPVANSAIVSITASSPSARKAQELANGFATASVQLRTTKLHQALDPAIGRMRARIQAITGGKGAGSAAANGSAQPLYQQLAAMEALRSAADPTLRVEAAATLPTSPASPQTKSVVLAGVLGGILIGAAAAFLLNALDPRRSLEDGSGLGGLSVLTRVPLLGRHGRTRHAFDESFRSLRTTLRFASAENVIRTIAVTSASEKEGKTTTSFQLAMAMLEAGQSVLLVEGDPFRPGLRSLLESYGGPARPGLLEYLSEDADLDDIIERTPIPGLMFVPAGFRQPPSITGLLEGERGRSFVNDVAGLADVVILDCPPVGPRSDAVLIASRADAVIMVVDLQSSDERDVLETVRRLRQTGARLLGMVLNRDTSATTTYDYEEQKPRSGIIGRKMSLRR